VVSPLLGDLNGYFSASFQFCAFALDGSKLESGGDCMYKVTSSRGRTAQEQSKVSPRISFSFSANNSHHITFTCSQPCVVAVLVTAVSNSDLPALGVQASTPLHAQTNPPPPPPADCMHDQAASTAPAPAPPVPAAKSPAKSPAQLSSPAQAMWDVQKLMEVHGGKPSLRFVCLFCSQVLSLDRNTAIELLKRNQGSVDAAISAHFGAMN
jgi:hypothetical protein